jgi:hypothetical protein
MILTDTSEQEYLLLKNNYKVFQVKNVSDYTYNKQSHSAINVTLFTPPNDLNTNYYFIIDTDCNEAFGHWVFESSIYLHLYTTLKETISSLKLVLKCPKMYKQIFTTFFGITDIVYTLDTTSANISYFPSPVSCLIVKECTPTNMAHLTDFMIHFYMYKLPPQLDNILYDFLIMPRQKKENYAPNDRIIDYSPICNFFETNKGYSYKILHTDDVTDLEQQIRCIRNAKNIIVTDGSPLFCNMLFGTNKTFYVLDGTLSFLHTYELPKNTYIVKMAKNVFQHKIVYIKQSVMIEKIRSGEIE